MGLQRSCLGDGTAPLAAVCQTHSVNGQHPLLDVKSRLEGRGY